MVDGFSCILDFPKFSGGGPPDPPYKGNTSIKPSKSFFNNNSQKSPPPLKSTRNFSLGYTELKKGGGRWGNIFFFVWFVIGLFKTLICAISSQSHNIGGHWGTSDDVATIPFHLSLSSAALRESPNPIPLHSLMLSSYLFFCLPLLLAPFIVPCRIVFAMPEHLEMWPYHLSFRFFTMVGRSSCIPVAFWILLRTSSFVTWFL